MIKYFFTGTFWPTSVILSTMFWKIHWTRLRSYRFSNHSWKSLWYPSPKTRNKITFGLVILLWCFGCYLYITILFLLCQYLFVIFWNFLFIFCLLLFILIITGVLTSLINCKYLFDSSDLFFDPYYSIPKYVPRRQTAQTLSCTILSKTDPPSGAVRFYFTVFCFIVFRFISPGCS